MNKLASIGVVVVIVFAALYLGNKVLTTTPESGAAGVTQYKVITIAGMNGNSPQDGAQQVEALLNQNAADGWRLVEANITLLILGK